MTDSMLVTITDLYCEGISEPIPWSGTVAEFEEKREWARTRSGGRGSRAFVLRWAIDGLNVVLNLNKTSVVAMVERRVPAP